MRGALSEHTQDGLESAKPDLQSILGISRQRYVKFRGTGQASVVSTSELHVSQSSVVKQSVSAVFPGIFCISTRISFYVHQTLMASIVCHPAWHHFQAPR